MWETRYVQKDTNSRNETLLFAERKKWNQKEIYIKFNSINFNSYNYVSNESAIQHENLGNYIQQINVSAYDDENMEQIATVNIYEIENISNKCAIAIQFENDENYYIYINLYYVPNTLNDLVNDLNLKEIISISSISYNYKYRNKEGTEQNENIEFENIKENDILNILFNNLSLKNLHEEANLHREYEMSIKCNILLLNSDIQINITNDDYLTTNVLGTEKIFYIGNQKKQEFINYIINNYIGHKIVYVDDTEDEETYPDDKILTIYNSVKQ